ncbi:MAG: phosphonoacetate hydrolase [Planctomycetota bacterium]
MAAISSTEFSVNHRQYRPPARPIAVLCLDGCSDDYIDTAIAQNRMPVLEKMIDGGFRAVARGALPSFTNVNNSAIVTGVPPLQTGISGNFFLDPETGEEVMMNSSKYLRCGTILAAASDAGRKVAMVTAKEKLRDILSLDLPLSSGEAFAFSTEKASEAKPETHGIGDVEEVVGRPQPEIYSGDASLYVLDAGVALIERGLADFCYLSLTDFMQHAYEPKEKPMLDFMAGIDAAIGKLLDLDCVVAATADHGMNFKVTADGTPNVIFLETMLTEQFGSGIRVICPITDPYVAHHGALGSAVTVHLPDHLDRVEVASFIGCLDGVTEVLDREGAEKDLELPGDRIGDLYVLSGQNVVLGRRPEDHDLSQLHGHLRSHGGRFEELVPMLISEPLAIETAELRNFDIFDLACNYHLSGQEG